MDGTKEITLHQLIRMLLKNKIPIVLCCILGVLASFAFATLFLVEKYESSVKLYVYTSDSEQPSVSQDLNALNYAQKVVDTYIQMLDTRQFYKEVKTVSQLPYSEGALKGMIRFSVLNQTEVFQATVVSAYPEDSMAIAQAVAEIAPRMIERIKENALLKIVDPPALNTQPVSPNLRQNLMLGFLIGAIGAALLIFLKEILDTKIKTGEDLYERHQLHVLAEIGDINKDERNKNARKSKRKHRKKGLEETEKSEAPVGLHENKVYLEGYKTARTNLIFSVLKNDCRKLVVVSPVSKEGKTTTCVNLAAAFAQQIGVKVLLIDCDFRKPRLNRYFGLTNTPGLTDYLGGFNDFADILRQTPIENLSLISAGTIPPNPSELLGSEAFEAFLRDVEKDYDFIIIDTSPLNVVIDALNLIRYADGVVFSAVQEVSSHPELAKTLDLLKSVDAKMAGVVLHGVEKNKKKHYGYNYYYYN